jgi:hypothetical protein
VELDYQLQSTAVSLTTGSGNFGGSNLASDSNPASATSGLITVIATGLRP